ncbi:hypothetical protein [Streptosporangium oxazolinicum]|uniref:hypothetical protein n=1 Tax=Streptosporangium oxazolinicum TaxID=909287 RepID=UPI0031F19F17
MANIATLTGMLLAASWSIIDHLTGDKETPIGSSQSGGQEAQRRKRSLPSSSPGERIAWPLT